MRPDEQSPPAGEGRTPRELTDVEIAERFHEAYERLAPAFGYETREASAKPWADVPEQNRALMTAVVAEVRELLPSAPEAGEQLGDFKDALGDALMRAFCADWTGGVASDYRPLSQAEVLADPGRIRWLVALQRAAWEVVERFTEPAAPEAARELPATIVGALDQAADELERIVDLAASPDSDRESLSQLEQTALLEHRCALRSLAEEVRSAAPEAEGASSSGDREREALKRLSGALAAARGSLEYVHGQVGTAIATTAGPVPEALTKAYNQAHDAVVAAIRVEDLGTPSPPKGDDARCMHERIHQDREWRCGICTDGRPPDGVSALRRERVRAVRFEREQIVRWLGGEEAGAVADAEIEQGQPGWAVAQTLAAKVAELTLPGGLKHADEAIHVHFSPPSPSPTGGEAEGAREAAIKTLVDTLIAEGRVCFSEDDGTIYTEDRSTGYETVLLDATAVRSLASPPAPEAREVVLDELRAEVGKLRRKVCPTPDLDRWEHGWQAALTSAQTVVAAFLRERLGAPEAREGDGGTWLARSRSTPLGVWHDLGAGANPATAHPSWIEWRRVFDRSPASVPVEGDARDGATEGGR